MKRRSVVLAGLFGVLSFIAPQRVFGAEPAGLKDTALREKATAAVEKGLTFLAQKQSAEGSWSTADYPGLTGLVVQAFLTAAGEKHADSKAVNDGLKFIRQSAKPDGGIYNKGMGNYNTAIALSTLVRAGKPEDQKLIDGARKYLIGAQASNSANAAENGGFGYEAGKSGRMTRPDLSNTYFVMESLALAKKAAATQDRPREQDLNWEAAISFVSRCQNLSSSNKESWVSEAPAEKGGFTYTPTATGEGTHSYGTMSYAGLMSMLHAELTQDDPRVKAALEWLSRRFTVEENPGQGAQGLYYYYYVMAKGLAAARIDALKKEDGGTIAWREELAKKLLSLQNPDGSWVNTDGRWMETNPILVTAYTVTALNTLLQQP